MLVKDMRRIFEYQQLEAGIPIPTHKTELVTAILELKERGPLTGSQIYIRKMAGADVVAARSMGRMLDPKVRYLLVSSYCLVRTTYYSVLTTFQMEWARTLDARLRFLLGMPPLDGADDRLGFEDYPEVGISQYATYQPTLYLPTYQPTYLPDGAGLREFRGPPLPGGGGHP